MSALREILRGTGPAPLGYVGPCACDPEFGSHFHRYEVAPGPALELGSVVGWSITGSGLRPVLTCGCVDHPVGSAFYSSAQYGGRTIALSGPYATHDEALAAVRHDREWAQARDPRAPWYAYGTFAATAGARVWVARGDVL